MKNTPKVRLTSDQKKLFEEVFDEVGAIFEKHEMTLLEVYAFVDAYGKMLKDKAAVLQNVPE